MKHKLIVALATLSLPLAGTLNAAFVNGGFETGDTTGWLVQSGFYSNGTVSGVSTTTTHTQAIGVGGPADAYSPFDSPFQGNYMMRLNEQNPPDATWTRISQTAVIGATDLFIAWASVMEDPAGHDLDDKPFFEISIFKNGSLIPLVTEYHSSDQGAAGGWTTGTPFGPNGSQVYYSSGVFNLIGAFDPTDTVTVQLTVADCGLTGHSGWAYLDGIGTVRPPNPTGGSVPDGGTTLVMLGGSLLGMLGISRKFRK